MLNLSSFKSKSLYLYKLSRSVILLTHNKDSLKLDMRLLLEYITLTYSTVRKVLGLPSLKTRTRSKRKVLLNREFSDYFLLKAYPYNSKYRLSEFYNII